MSEAESLQSLNRVLEKTNEMLYSMLVKAQTENERLRVEVDELKTDLNWRQKQDPVDTRPDWMKKTDD